jgi:capsule polysaccharide export protein KpsE/RkpR
MPKFRISNSPRASLQVIVLLQEELIVANECLAQLQAHIPRNLRTPSVYTSLRSLGGAIAAQSKGLPGNDFAATSPCAGRLPCGR